MFLKPNKEKEKDLSKLINAYNDFENFLRDFLYNGKEKEECLTRLHESGLWAIDSLMKEK